MKEILFHIQLNKLKLREVSNLSDIQVNHSRAASGAQGGSGERQMVVSATDNIYPHNLLSTALDVGRGW